MVALQTGALPSPGKVFPSSFAPGAEAGPCSISSPAAPQPCALSSQPRRRKRLRGAGTAGPAEEPGQKDCSPKYFLSGFSPFLNFSSVHLRVFLGVNGPEHYHGTNISDLIILNQPLTLVLIKADIHTAGPASPKEHYDM